MWEGDFYSTGGGGERAGPKGLGERLPGQPGSQIIKRHETFGSDWYQFRAPTEKELLAKKDIPALPPEIAGRRQQVEAGKEFPTPPELAHAEPSPENPHYPVLGNLHMAIDQGRHTRRDPEMSRTIPSHNQELREMSHARAASHEKAAQENLLTYIIQELEQITYLKDQVENIQQCRTGTWDTSIAEFVIDFWLNTSMVTDDAI